MTKAQEAKLSMYNSVLAHCTQNAAVTAGIPALQTAVAALKTTAAAIQSAAQQQLQSTKGYTAGKAASRGALESFAVHIAGAIFAWASDNKENVIIEKTKTVPSTLTRLRDEELALVCREYYETGKTNITALADYGISQAVLDEFMAAINAYVQSVPGPRNAQALRTAYKKSLIELFKTGDGILKNKIDKLSIPLQKTNKSWMDAYKSNRIIVDAGTTATQLRVNIINAVGVPVKGAVVAIESLAYSAQAGANGSIIIKPILQGAYSLTVSMQGYKTLVLDDVRVLRGQVNTQDVTLQSAA